MNSNPDGKKAMRSGTVMTLLVTWLTDAYTDALCILDTQNTYLTDYS